MKRQYKSFDIFLFLAVCALAIFGIIMIGSATLGDAFAEESSKQRLWLVLGIAILMAAAVIDYHFICRFYIVIYVVCLGLLAAVLAYGLLFPDTTDTSRWFTVGGVKVQPSEFTKIFMVIFLASFVNRHAEEINRPRYIVLCAVFVAVPVLLIMAQPSLSAAIVPLFLSAAVLFVGGIDTKYILLAALLGIPSAYLVQQDLMRAEPIILSKILNAYQLGRLQTHFGPSPDPDAVYQSKNALEALASGQLSGKGLYNGFVTQLGRIPEAHNDFIFSVIGEEMGFIGCVAVLAVMLFIIIRCLIIAHRSCDLLGRLIATGVAAMFACQVFVNVGVATSLLPNTGMPFPFISYGGSSLWVNMAAVGLVINVGMTRTKSIFEG